MYWKQSSLVFNRFVKFITLIVFSAFFLFYFFFFFFCILYSSLGSGKVQIYDLDCGDLLPYDNLELKKVYFTLNYNMVPPLQLVLNCVLLSLFTVRVKCNTRKVLGVQYHRNQQNPRFNSVLQWSTIYCRSIEIEILTDRSKTFSFFIWSNAIAL